MLSCCDLPPCTVWYSTLPKCNSSSTLLMLPHPPSIKFCGLPLRFSNTVVHNLWFWASAGTCPHKLLSQSRSFRSHPSISFLFSFTSRFITVEYLWKWASTRPGVGFGTPRASHMQCCSSLHCLLHSTRFYNTLTSSADKCFLTLSGKF